MSAVIWVILFLAAQIIGGWLSWGCGYFNGRLDQIYNLPDDPRLGLWTHMKHYTFGIDQCQRTKRPSTPTTEGEG